VCIERNKLDLNELEFNTIVGAIKPLLKEKPLTLEELASACGQISEDKVVRAVQWLEDNDKVSVDRDEKYRWK
jgi:hypothetical protein